MKTSQALPVTLVTGFLGSGKTSFLQHIASQPKPEHKVFLINDFSSQGVDAASLDGTSGIEIIPLSGGSILCRCMAGTFAKALSLLLEDWETGNQRIDELYIETSGIADPAAFGTVIAEHGLDRRICLRSITTLAVPSTLIKLLPLLPVIRSQIASAHRILFNKWDICSPKEIEEASRIIASIRPDLIIEMATHGVARNLPSSESLCFFPAKADPIPDNSGVFLSRNWSIDSPVEAPALAQILNDTGAGLFRAKGFLPSPSDLGRSRLFNWTPEQWSLDPIEVHNDTGVLVAIGRRSALADLSHRMSCLFPS